MGGHDGPVAAIYPPGAIESGWFWSIGEDALSFGDFLVRPEVCDGRCRMISRFSVPISLVELLSSPLRAVRLLYEGC